MNNNNNNNYYAIIVAGGKGERMQSQLPKQFLKLGDKTILEHTISSFAAFLPVEHIVVVMHEMYLEYWNKCVEENKWKIFGSVAGGATRFHSVQNGLAHLQQYAPDSAIVGIHDAVRPFADRELLQRCYEAAALRGAAIPVVPLNDSLRRLRNNQGDSEPVNRAAYVAVQTPQCFRFSVLQAAYIQDFREVFTDDASVVEAYGQAIILVAGQNNNIKLTTPPDFAYAQWLYEQQQPR
ncbi:MAG: 2-C-methyl-D-erythritol 4-phosphate cytidylyltransferase [Sphingobacteriales bacterium]|nr:2-C-methyl-D-erythritol 4-phosphate cytidylyltransferase [Sphingobacteriales bacterium]